MFKRANKITALLVAAASIMSIVPAMAADSTRLGTKDGTITDAIAYKDGKYAFEGYKTDADNKSVYFNDGTKDKEINDLTDARINDDSKYDNSSTIAWDGNDEYLLDLATGKVTDEDVASDLKSTAKDKLIAKLKKTDRYGASVSVNSFGEITTDQFGDVWYAYEASKDGANDTDGTKAVIKQTIPVAGLPATIKIGGESITTTGTPAVTGGYVSDNVASWAAVAQTQLTTALGANYTVAVSTTTGEVTLTQKDLPTIDGDFTNDTNKFLNADALQAVSAGFKVGTDYVAPTLSQVSSSTLPAIVKFQPTSFDKDIKVMGITVVVNVTGESAITTAAALKTAVDAHTFANYDVSTVESATGIVVTLTQKHASNFTQNSIVSSDYAPYSATAGSLNPQVTTNGVVSTVVSSGNTTYNGYTNKSGAYIDADKTANIRVYSAGKMVKLDEFDETVNDDNITATVTDSHTIAQDKDYIYRVIDVKFTGSTAVIYNSKGNTKIFDPSLATPVDNVHTYLQKISKAQGDTEKDAYLPKTVESYEVTADLSDSDIALGKEKLLNAIGTVSNGKTFIGLRVVDGAIYYTEMDTATKIKTYKFKFSKNEKIEVSTNNKVDAYVIKKDADKDHDLKGEAGGVDGSSFDVDGNLWIINEGKIYQSIKGGDFKEVFTVDRSIDSLDVYNKESLVAWDGDGNVYTTNQEGTKVTAAEATVVAPVVVTGWVQGTDGSWTFNDATGTKVANKWVNVGGAWYFLKADGVMATNWYNDNGTWYYLKSSGAMATGWVNDNGTWYYCNASGAMLANTTVDGYVLNASGAWVK